MRESQVKFSTLVLAVVMLFGFIGCEATTEKSKSASTTAGTVSLKIVFNSDRNDILVDVPCSKDSTVFQILERARNMGDLEFESTGKDETVFVNSIGGVDNLKGEGDNWIYKVNGKLGNKSCGVFAVQTGDEVQWSFGKYP